MAVQESERWACLGNSRRQGCVQVSVAAAILYHELNEVGRKQQGQCMECGAVSMGIRPCAGGQQQLGRHARHLFWHLQLGGQHRARRTFHMVSINFEGRLPIKGNSPKVSTNLQIKDWNLLIFCSRQLAAMDGIHNGLGGAWEV